MRALISTLTLLPVALIAQAPAPAAQAPASLSDQIKAQAPAIEALKKNDPAAALAKAEALIPAIAPVYNKTDFAKAQDSMGEFNALSDIYRTAASCADAAGQWEKAQDYATKAKAAAQANYDGAQQPFNAFKDSWKKAQAEAQKNLDEEATLAKVEKPTAEQVNRLAFLQHNQAVFQKNVDNGKAMVDAVDARLNLLKDQTNDFDPFIANITERLKSEAANLDKFKGDKKAFAAAALKGADAYKDKDQEVTYLRRLQVLDPSSKAIAHKIDVLLGKAKDEPVKRHTPRKKKSH
ncbi:MAG: hypothetical protein JST24_09805 [Acidobacteria bacterium]|nr:hypothetical protein [Acidobacteriota bacterium]